MKIDNLTAIILVTFGLAFPIACGILLLSLPPSSVAPVALASPPAQTSSHRPDWAFSERAARRRNVRECLKLFSEYCGRAWIVPQLGRKARTKHGWKFTGFILSKSGRIQHRYEYLVKYANDGLMYTYKFCGPCR